MPMQMLHVRVIGNGPVVRSKNLFYVAWLHKVRFCHLRQYSCCSKSTLKGLIIGALVAGVALATVLTLYLHKPRKTPFCKERERASGACSTRFAILGSCIVYSPTTATLTTTIVAMTVPVTATTTSMSTASLGFSINLVKNGDAETGLCSTNRSISSPTGWSYSGPISQLCYNNSQVPDQTDSTPGPR